MIPHPREVAWVESTSFSHNQWEEQSKYGSHLLLTELKSFVLFSDTLVTEDTIEQLCHMFLPVFFLTTSSCKIVNSYMSCYATLINKYIKSTNIYEWRRVKDSMDDELYWWKQIVAILSIGKSHEHNKLKCFLNKQFANHHILGMLRQGCLCCKIIIWCH